MPAAASGYDPGNYSRPRGINGIEIKRGPAEGRKGRPKAGRALVRPDKWKSGRPEGRPPNGYIKRKWRDRFCSPNTRKAHSEEYKHRKTFEFKTRVHRKVKSAESGPTHAISPIINRTIFFSAPFINQRWRRPTAPAQPIHIRRVALRTRRTYPPTRSIRESGRNR